MSAPGDHDATGTPGPVPDPDHLQPRSGLQMAREALAAARAQARRRGSAPSAAGSGPRPDAPGDPGREERRHRASRAPSAGLSGPGPDDRDPQLMGRAIERLLADRGWETEAAVGSVLGRWTQVVGPQVAEHCTPQSCTDGELVLLADSTAWATQLRLMSASVVRLLEQELGPGTIRTVRVLGPAAPSWRRGRLAVPGRGPRDTYG